MSVDQERFARAELDRLAVELADLGAVEAISGMALGADTWWAQSALAAGLDLAAYIPCLEQTDGWTSADREVWQQLRDAAARERVVGVGATAATFHARNDAMLADADVVIAVLDPAMARGGTVATYRKAVTAGMPTIVVDVAAGRTTLQRSHPTGLVERV